MNGLKAHWIKLASVYSGDNSIIDELWLEIEKSHTSNGRYYHNLTHLQYMIDKALLFRENLSDLDTILFSIFYHDIVYNVEQHDNEQKSSEIAVNRMERLAVPTNKIVNCQRQIVATKEHKNSVDNDTNYLLDFDLAILGDTPENYMEYTHKIRKEYSIYPDFLYTQGRKKVLQHFLDMDNIFKTDIFRNNYEAQARENIRAELNKL